MRGLSHKFYSVDYKIDSLANHLKTIPTYVERHVVQNSKLQSASAIHYFTYLLLLPSHKFIQPPPPPPLPLAKVAHGVNLSVCCTKLFKRDWLSSRTQKRWWRCNQRTALIAAAIGNDKLQSYYIKVVLKCNVRNWLNSAMHSLLVQRGICESRSQMSYLSLRLQLLTRQRGII